MMPRHHFETFKDLALQSTTFKPRYPPCVDSTVDVVCAPRAAETRAGVYELNSLAESRTAARYRWTPHAAHREATGTALYTTRGTCNNYS